MPTIAWLLLVYRVPSEPASKRVTIWRDLKRLGALYLQQCVCLVPHTEALQEARRIRRQYGQELWLCVGRCVYYKGYQTAIEALPHVRGKLIVIGHGPLEGALGMDGRHAAAFGTSI